MNRLMLIDGNNIAYRAFYALPLLSNSKGMYTNAVYGFTTMLLRLLQDYQPSHIMVAFDAGKSTFRHETYGDYKGTRQKTPDELSGQFEMLKEVLDAFKVYRFELQNYEADDIIGTVSRMAEAEGWETLIVSGDRDLLQLVSDHVRVLMSKKGITEVETYGKSEIQEKYGLTPEQIIDLKGLMGDASDNIPGIPGVGEKTALKLLHQFGSVEETVRHAEQISGKKLQEKVAEHAEQALLSKRLATIHRDVPIDFALQQLAYEGYEPQRLISVLKKYEFSSIVERIPEAAAPQTQDVQIQGDGEQPFVVIDESARSGWLERLYQAETVAIAFVMHQAGYHLQPPAALALFDGKESAVLPFNLIREWQPFLDWLADDARKKVVFDAKQLWVSLHWEGIALGGIIFDCLLAAYLLSTAESGLDLSDLANQKSAYYLPPDEAIYGKGAKFHVPDVSVWMPHLAKKAVVLADLYPKLKAELAEREMTSLYDDVELPLTFVLAEMETNGIKVDPDRLNEMGKALTRQIEQLTGAIFDLAGVEFNINSPKQLGEILFDKLGLPAIKKTKTGYSTSADVLEKLAPQHEIVSLILHYRQLVKLQTTYVEGLLKMIHPKTGKIHTIFNQTVAATGRLSSTEPNLQNIPIRMEEGRKLRQVFVPSQGCDYILAADYSQIELRVLAHISEDPNLLQAFLEDRDIHTSTAMSVFGVAADQVDANLRRQAKAVNFGIVYGISDYGLSQNLNIPRKEAAQFIERYFEVFQGVKAYMDKAVKQAKLDGYVSTLLHRRRYLPDIKSRNFNLRSFAERTAMNTPIQGTAADIIKLAMVKMARRMKREKVRSRMLLQVHDELIFEVTAGELEQMKTMVKEEMEGALELRVPLKVDVNAGPTWYEAK